MMATADGMEGSSVPQVQPAKGNTSGTQDWGAALVSETLKQIQSPLLWAGAVAGFVAGTVVTLAAKTLWRRFKG